MLIIKGTAELMAESDEYIKGNRYEFIMFSAASSLDSELDKIEKYFINKGWDNIEIYEHGVLENDEQVEHPVLQAAYKQAVTEGLAVTINKMKDA